MTHIREIRKTITDIHYRYIRECSNMGQKSYNSHDDHFQTSLTSQIYIYFALLGVDKSYNNHDKNKLIAVKV